jgi:hypothetical protein
MAMATRHHMHNVSLPMRLARPSNVKEVDQAALIAIDPTLADTPAAYLRDKLQRDGMSKA